jgi:mRNA interferase HigB
VRVMARGTLNLFVRNRVEKSAQTVVKGQLDVWFAELTRATWKNSAELKKQFTTASVVSSERVVFNIKGNDYRLVAAIDYRFQIAFVIWIGTHREYDKINVEKVGYDKERYTGSSHS